MDMKFTPTEKAKELLNRYRRLVTDMHGFTSTSNQRKAAIIAAKEVRENIPMYTGSLNPKWKFWDDVIFELEHFNLST